jgi:phosphoglycerate dehydrogenase-like enzyme
MKDGVGINCARGGVIELALKGLDSGKNIFFGLDVLRVNQLRNDYFNAPQNLTHTTYRLQLQAKHKIE